MSKEKMVIVRKKVRMVIKKKWIDKKENDFGQEKSSQKCDYSTWLGYYQKLENGKNAKNRAKLEDLQVLPSFKAF